MTNLCSYCHINKPLIQVKDPDNTDGSSICEVCLEKRVNNNEGTEGTKFYSWDETPRECNRCFNLIMDAYGDMKKHRLAVREYRVKDYLEGRYSADFDEYCEQVVAELGITEEDHEELFKGEWVGEKPFQEYIPDRDDAKMVGVVAITAITGVIIGWFINNQIISRK